MQFEQSGPDVIWSLAALILNWVMSALWPGRRGSNENKVIRDDNRVFINDGGGDGDDFG